MKLNAERVEGIVATCREQGLEISEVSQEGAVLILQGSPGQELPRREELAALAEGLRTDGVRYVTWELGDE